MKADLMNEAIQQHDISVPTGLQLDLGCSTARVQLVAPIARLAAILRANSSVRRRVPRFRASRSARPSDPAGLIGSPRTRQEPATQSTVDVDIGCPPF